MTTARHERKKRLSDFLVAFIMLLLGIGIALAFLWNFVRYWGIEQRGVETLGYITEARAPRPKNKARILYQYEVDGQSRQGHSEVDDAYYESVKDHEGEEIPIVYFKDYPRLSAIRGYNNYKNLWVYFFVTVLFLPLGLYLMINSARDRGQTGPSA
ncbi:MAG: hypothetical protein K8L91_22605 [Anaerolineae bacterium]|nr:hypothetical protein [Anaerolineae bacterium]